MHLSVKILEILNIFEDNLARDFLYQMSNIHM